MGQRGWIAMAVGLATVQVAACQADRPDAQARRAPLAVDRAGVWPPAPPERKLQQTESEQRSASTPAAAPGTVEQARSIVVEGTIERVDIDELVIDQGDGQELRLRISPETPVTTEVATDRGPPEVIDVAAGTPVRVEYHLESGQPVADLIQVTRAR